MLLRIGRVARRVEHREVGLHGAQLGLVRAEEHVIGEKGVPCVVGDHPYVDGVMGVCTGSGIPNEQLLTVQVVDHALPEQTEAVFGDRHVDLAPVHRVGGRGLVHRELVVRGATRMGSGHRGECAHVHKPSLAPGQGLFVETGR